MQATEGSLPPGMPVGSRAWDRSSVPAVLNISPEDALSLGAQAYDQLLQSISSPFAPVNLTRTRQYSQSMNPSAMVSQADTAVGGSGAHGPPSYAHQGVTGSGWPDIPRPVPHSRGGSSDHRLFSPPAMHPQQNLVRQGSMDPQIQEFHRLLVAGASALSAAGASYAGQTLDVDTANFRSSTTQASNSTMASNMQHHSMSMNLRASSPGDASALAARAHELRLRREALWAEAQRIAAQEAEVVAAMAAAGGGGGNGGNDPGPRSRTRQQMDWQGQQQQQQLVMQRSNTSSTLSPSSSAIHGHSGNTPPPPPMMPSSSGRHGSSNFAAYVMYAPAQQQHLLQQPVSIVQGSQESMSGTRGNADGMHWSQQLNMVLENCASLQQAQQQLLLPASNGSVHTASTTGGHGVPSAGHGMAYLGTNSNTNLMLVGQPSASGALHIMGSSNSNLGSLGLPRSRRPSQVALQPAGSGSLARVPSGNPVMGANGQPIPVEYAASATMMPNINSPTAGMQGSGSLPISTAGMNLQRMQAASPMGTAQGMRVHGAMSPQQSSGHSGLPAVPEGASLTHTPTVVTSIGGASQGPGKQAMAMQRGRSIGRQGQATSSSSQQQLQGSSLSQYGSDLDTGAGSGGTPRSPGMQGAGSSAGGAGTVDVGMSSTFQSDHVAASAAAAAAAGMFSTKTGTTSSTSMNSMADVQLGTNWDVDTRRSIVANSRTSTATSGNPSSGVLAHHPAAPAHNQLGAATAAAVQRVTYQAAGGPVTPQVQSFAGPHTSPHGSRGAANGSGGSGFGPDFLNLPGVATPVDALSDLPGPTGSRVPSTPGIAAPVSAAPRPLPAPVPAAAPRPLFSIAAQLDMLRGGRPGATESRTATAAAAAVAQQLAAATAAPAGGSYSKASWNGAPVQPPAWPAGVNSTAAAHHTPVLHLPNSADMANAPGSLIPASAPPSALSAAGSTSRLSASMTSVVAPVQAGHSAAAAASIAVAAAGAAGAASASPAASTGAAAGSASGSKPAKKASHVLSKLKNKLFK
uniref:Uncharacterized protein n=1 Tax=Chlamydomonas leiostraca TaxID=1034604 RepID=A0A7S0RES1_9CHLO